MSGSLWIGKIPGTTVAPRTNVFCGGGRCCRRIHGRRAVEIARRLLGVKIRVEFMMLETCEAKLTVTNSTAFCGLPPVRLNFGSKCLR
jgi:hypothetical protein